MTERQQKGIILVLSSLLALAVLALSAIGVSTYIDYRIATAIRLQAGGDLPSYPLFVGAVRQDFSSFNQRLARLEPSPIPTTAPPGP